MNRRDFVRKSVGVVVAGSLIAGEERLAAQSSAQPADKKSLSPANWTIAGKEIRVHLGEDGTIRALQVNNAGQWEDVAFRQGVLAGPAWAGVKMQRVEGSANIFAGVANGVRHLLGYRLDGDRLVIVATIKNEAVADYSPKAARIVLGIDCEMRSFPSWDYRYFPTLFRCEKTHFWGYFMTPKGRIMTIGSPDPVASYSFNYDDAVWSHGDGGAPLKDDSKLDVWKHGYVDGGHLIFTSSLDMLHALPLPPRHPQNLGSLKPGEERTWTIYLEPAESIDEVKPALAASLGSPMIDADRYTVAAGETSRLTVWASKDVKAAVMLPDGGGSPLTLHSIAEGKFAVDFVPQAGPGLYKITVTQSDGHISEASVSVRHPWAWYMNQARKDTLINKQYASSHLEQWLGLETDVLARLYLPDPSLDAETDKRLKEILNLQWDLTTKKPSNIPIIYRHLVNTAQMAAVLAWRYRSDRDPYWLDLASGFADYVVSRQLANGDYDKYTAVAYPVKAVMTVMAAEKTMAATDPRYKAAYERHYASAKMAMDFLVRSEDDLVTEGENTFEDGMISCSALQLGLFALLQKDPAERCRYADASRKMLLSHRCLEQLLIPDSRMNGATLRFWEAQYDTLIGNARNMMDSPHGWSAWLIPALWYQYLLTGEEVWLRKAMNSMGSCAQLIDSKTGQLRWAFVPDPYREVTMLEPNSANPMRGKRVDRIIGEQYVPMIAAFHYPDHEPVCGNGWDSGWTCCNDVHEVFTSMAEMALTSAYVLERENGELVAWNCKATLDSAGGISIHPAEEVVVRVHLNLLRAHAVKATFADAVVAGAQPKGMHWIGPGGEPELIRD